MESVAFLAGEKREAEMGDGKKSAEESVSVTDDESSLKKFVSRKQTAQLF